MADKDKETRMRNLRTEIVYFEGRIAKHENELERERARLRETGVTEHASAVVQRHIRALHEYNEMRDVALAFLTMVAENKTLPLEEVHKEYGVKDKD